MQNKNIKIWRYIFLRYVISFVVLYSTNKSLTKIEWSDLQRGEDWFMFFWLFITPVIIELIIIGIPMTYGLTKLTNSNKVYIYLLFIVLFTIEFLFTSWIFAMNFVVIKLIISVLLFILLFWKRIFPNLRLR